MPFREYLPHYSRIILQILGERLHKAVFLVKAKWWGIKIGQDLTMSGVMKIRKTPGSNITIGDRCRILSKFDSNLHGLNRKSMFSTLSGNAILKIGNDCGFSGLVIACSAEVTIGNRVMIGANCTITDTDSHSLNYKERYPDYYNLRNANWKEEVKSLPVIIEDDVFIGMNTIVLKGATIGKGSIIGAGSVITKSIPSFVIAAGNPAVIIRKIDI
jgi:acetyltransferase-like isoleucine patch superfamily enzyme